MNSSKGIEYRGYSSGRVPPLLRAAAVCLASDIYASVCRVRLYILASFPGHYSCEMRPPPTYLA
jgi:hypothetical protein